MWLHEAIKKAYQVGAKGIRINIDGKRIRVNLPKDRRDTICYSFSADEINRDTWEVVEEKTELSKSELIKLCQNVVEHDSYLRTMLRRSEYRFIKTTGEYIEDLVSELFEKPSK